MSRRWRVSGSTAKPVFVATLVVAAAAVGAYSARGQSRPPQAAVRRPVLSPSLHGPSPIIYPPQRITLRMDHSHPAHRALRCVRCHTGAGGSERVADLLTPPESTCAPCHDEQLDRSEPSEARCGTCHVGYQVGDAPEVSEFPTARLSFSHRTHVQDGMRCITCHQGIERAELGDRRHLPQMRLCLRCHGPPEYSTSSTAPTACASCHLTQPDGRLRTRFDEGVLNPPSYLFNMRHDHEWSVRHRWVAADRGGQCATCHTENECAECHDGGVRPRSVHPGDYLTTHPAQARRDQPRCTSCHQVSRFCAECHARLGLAPFSAPAVRAAERYHPPASIWVRGPATHGLEAQRSMNTCVSCHAERDCVTCHGGLGIGAGLSPHPPGFTARCAAALERNSRACATCHGDLDGLRRRCR